MRLVRLGVRLAAWATPRVKEWHRERHLHRLEGERHLQSRNWSEAENHLTEALGERRHPTKLRIQLLLGLQAAQRNQNKLAAAEQSARTAIDVAKGSRDSAKVSESMEALLEVQLAQGNYADAEKTVREIINMTSGRSTSDPARLAQCTRKLGTALLKTDRTDEAMAAFGTASRLAEQAFGPNHAETANSLSELGMLQCQTGNHAEAQQTLRRALEIHRKVTGPDSTEATQDLSHLALSLEVSGDFDGAVGEYKNVLAMKERQIGGNREETAEVQARLAALYVRGGHPAPARELLTHAIGVLERKGGPRLVHALETMACADEEIGRTEEARRWREKASKLLANQAPQ
ncbi:MAG: tetratricopeptide repeat protein [Bryobacteraceae bacterium]|jgi:tetratricopeptide (TPR) repeat protein